MHSECANIASVPPYHYTLPLFPSSLATTALINLNQLASLSSDDSTLIVHVRALCPDLPQTPQRRGLVSARLVRPPI
jgi:hypothetical protein